MKVGTAETHRVLILWYIARSDERSRVNTEQRAPIEASGGCVPTHIPAGAGFSRRRHCWAATGASECSRSLPLRGRAPTLYLIRDARGLQTRYKSEPTRHVGRGARSGSTLRSVARQLGAIARSRWRSPISTRSRTRARSARREARRAGASPSRSTRGHRRFAPAAARRLGESRPLPTRRPGSRDRDEAPGVSGTARQRLPGASANQSGSVELNGSAGMGTPMTPLEDIAKQGAAALALANDTTTSSKPHAEQSTPRDEIAEPLPAPDRAHPGSATAADCSDHEVGGDWLIR